MAHVRQQIRAAVVAALKGHSAAGQNVAPHRVHAVAAARTPAIGVSTTDERSEIASNDADEECGKHYRRIVQVELDLVAHDDRADDRVDELAVEVERLMEVEPTFGGLARDLALVSSVDVFSGEGERMAGRKRLTYAATYLTKSTAPDVAL